MDEDLVRAFSNGDRTAFDRLVLLHQDRVYNLCFRFFGDHSEANDMAQEIFLKVYRSVDRFEFRSAFSTWLYKIAVNTCNNRLKSVDYRFRKLVKPWISEKGEPDVLELAQTRAASPLEELEQKERDALVRKAVEGLNNGKKTVLILRDFEGLSYEEIAVVTGFAIGTVKSKLARARQELCSELAGKI